MRPRVLFLEASDDVLVRRFETVRRAHPLQGDGRLIDGIAAERELLAGAARRGRPGDRHQRPVGARAAPGDRDGLRRRRQRAAPALRATVVSFGFKYGLPVDADLVVDVRFLPNPYWIPELRELTGEDARGARLRARPGATPREFLDRYTAVLQIIGAGYRREGKRYLTLAVGCTGGKHRSVVMAAGARRPARGDGRAGHRRAPGPRP